MKTIQTEDKRTGIRSTPYQPKWRMLYPRSGTPYIRQRRPGEPTRKQRRARPSTGTNQPRRIRVIRFEGEPCKWPQMEHVTMSRVTRRCLRA